MENRIELRPSFWVFTTVVLVYLFLLYFYMQVLPCFIIRLTEKTKKSTQFIEGAYASSIAKHLVEKQEETPEEKKKRLKKRVSVNTISSHRWCSIKSSSGNVAKFGVSFSDTGIFRWILRNSWAYLFYRTPPGDYFCNTYLWLMHSQF